MYVHTDRTLSSMGYINSMKLRTSIFIGKGPSSVPQKILSGNLNNITRIYLYNLNIFLTFAARVAFGIILLVKWYLDYNFWIKTNGLIGVTI